MSNEWGPREWRPLSQELPEEGVAVETKIDYGNGARNDQQLKRKGGLWFYTDMSMYVYYTPTHWRFPG